MRIFTRLMEAIEAEGGAALVTILSAVGSSPRDAGARLVVRPNGGFHGSIGGGTLEWQALGEARRALLQGRGQARRIDQALGPDLGQCCGGRVALLIETFDDSDRAEIARLAEFERAGAFETEAVLGPDGRLERRIIRAGDAAALRPRPPVTALPDGRIIENFGRQASPLLLFGAGHVGRAVILALAPLPFEVRWIDSRAEAFPAAVPDNVTKIFSADPAAELAAAPASAFVVVMTHSHPLDLDITTAALRGERFPYVGLIGSATKRSRFVGRMRAAGLTPAEIGRLVCPIGIAGIGGKEPAVIAASLAAELLVRRQQATSAGMERVA